MPVTRAVLAAPLLVLLLAGCVPTSDPTSAPTSDPTTPAPTATSTPSPTATITPAPDAIPLSIACDTLISDQAIYDYNSNYSLVGEFSPAPGTLAAEVLEAQGTACRWVNQTSGDTIDIAAAHLNDEALATAQADASGSAASSYDGYFTPGAGQAFSGSFWVTAESQSFGEEADVSQLITTALGAVG